MKSKKQAMQEKRQRARMTARLAWGGALLVVLSLVGYLVWSATRPQPGREVPVMADTSHVPDGSDPGPYNSNPPSSGKHYPTDLEPGFYEDAQAAALGEYPEGYLVHNLEHGYVIFWYNCAAYGPENCGELKADIQSVMEQENNFKVIAFPWNETEYPLVLTSWGQIQEFERFDAAAALAFVQQNRNKAPEPMAD